MATWWGGIPYHSWKSGGTNKVTDIKQLQNNNYKTTNSASKPTLSAGQIRDLQEEAKSSNPAIRQNAINMLARYNVPLTNKQSVVIGTTSSGTPVWSSDRTFGNVKIVKSEWVSNTPAPMPANLGIQPGGILGEISKTPVNQSNKSQNNYSYPKGAPTIENAQKDTSTITYLTPEQKKELGLIPKTPTGYKASYELGKVYGQGYGIDIQEPIPKNLIQRIGYGASYLGGEIVGVLKNPNFYAFAGATNPTLIKSTINIAWKTPQLINTGIAQGLTKISPAAGKTFTGIGNTFLGNLAITTAESYAITKGTTKIADIGVNKNDLTTYKQTYGLTLQKYESTKTKGQKLLSIVPGVSQLSINKQSFKETAIQTAIEQGMTKPQAEKFGEYSLKRAKYGGIGEIGGTLWLGSSTELYGRQAVAKSFQKANIIVSSSRIGKTVEQLSRYPIFKAGFIEGFGQSIVTNVAEERIGRGFSTSLFPSLQNQNKIVQQSISSVESGVVGGIAAGFIGSKIAGYTAQRQYNTGKFYSNPIKTISGTPKPALLKELGYRSVGYGGDISEYPGDVLADIRMGIRGKLGLSTIKEPSINLVNTPYGKMAVFGGKGGGLKTRIVVPTPTEVLTELPSVYKSSSKTPSLPTLPTLANTNIFTPIPSITQTPVNTPISIEQPVIIPTPISVPATVPTTVPTTVPATVPATVPTTVPATVPATIPVTVPVPTSFPIIFPNLGGGGGGLGFGSIRKKARKRTYAPSIAGLSLKLKTPKLRKSKLLTSLEIRGV